MITASMLLIAALSAAGVFLVTLFFWIIALRRVVPVNEVHIVQTRKNTVSCGKGFDSNTYYEWPSRLPMIGLQRVTLPVSNFAIDLPDYAADGGTAVASMLEGLAQSPEGKKLLEKFVNKGEEKK